MRTKLVKIANLIIVAMFALFIAGYVFAWFNNDAIKRELEMEGASAAYFERGSGTYTDPFIITNERHIYNLSWLNNTGRFGDTKYYFKIKVDNDISKNITISENDWIPPIGTDAHPFYGDFDGNGYTITNLKVTTDKNKLRNSRYGTAYTLITEAEYAFSKAVGFFGKTAEGSNVHNFILDNPTVVVSSENSKYSSSGNSVVGLAIGHVGENASSIGVRDGNLAVEVNSYKSFNSILGELGVKAQANMSKGDGDIMAGDTGYFVPGELLKKSSALNKFFSSNGQVQDSYWLVAGSKNTLGLGSFSVSTSSGKDELASANVTSFTYYYSNEGDTATNVFDSNDGSYTIDLQTEPTDADVKAVWDEVKYVSGNTSTHLSALTGYWYFENTNEAVNTGTITVVNEDNEYMNTDGTVSASAVAAVYDIVKGGIKVNIETATPNNPSKIFVVAASRSSTATRELGLYKVYSAQSGSDISYSDFYAGATNAQTEVRLYKDNPLMKLVLPTGKAVVGCYFEVTEPGVYQLQSTGSGINFYYVSAQGVADGQGSEPPATERFELDNIDFIEDGDSISEGKLVTGTQAYNPTETWVFLNGIAQAIFVSYTRNGLNQIPGVETAYTLGITLYSSFDDNSDQLSGAIDKTTNANGIPVYENAKSEGIAELPFDVTNHKVQELEGNEIVQGDISVGPVGLSIYDKYIGIKEIEQTGGTITVTLDDFEIDLSGNSDGYEIISKKVSYNGAEIGESGISLGVGYHTFVIEVTCSNGTETKTLTAELSVNFVETAVYHSVTFVANLPGVTVENMPQECDVKDGNKITEPSKPTAEGYTFGGWYTVPECTEGYEYNFDTPVTEDITLYAKWTQNAVQTYTVTFMDGTSVIDTIAVNAGGKVEKPTDPTKDGYTFGGWYKDNTFTTPFDFDTTVINGNTPIYAKWISVGEQQTVENHYSFDALAAVVSDPAAGSLTLTQDDFTGVNSFITVVAGGTVNYRGPSNNVLEIKNEALSVTFQGTGTLVIQARSTSNSNTSSIAIKGPDGNYIEGTFTSANVQKDDTLNVYTVTGAMNEISFIISQPGTYTFCTLSSVTVNGTSVSTGRNTRIGAIDMTDTFTGSGTSATALNYDGQSVEGVSADFASIDLFAEVNKKQ